MRKIISTLSFLVIFLLVLSAWAGEFYAVVTKISDGDTIWIQTGTGEKIKVRFLGIDTPEEYSSSKLYRDADRCGVEAIRVKNLGKLATEHIEDLLQVGDTVKVVSRGYGYYGRLLAYIILPDDGTNLNYKMVEDGYACVYMWDEKKPDNVTDEEFRKLISLMQEAKSERKGLWATDFKLMSCLCPSQRVDKGDVNADMVVDLKDAILALKAAAGIDINICTDGDVNGDKKIGLEDAVFILKKISKN